MPEFRWSKGRDGDSDILVTGPMGTYVATISNACDEFRAHLLRSINMPAPVPAPAAKSAAALTSALTDLLNDVEASVDYGMPFEHPEHGFHESVKASYAALGLAFTPLALTVDWFNSNGISDAEAPIIQQCITDLLAAGFSISVVDDVHEDGDEILSDSTDAAAIYGALCTTEGDTLNVRRPHPNGKPDRFQIGFVQFVYGNDYDVIHEHSGFLGAPLAETKRVVHALYSQNN